ncbi:hypothetical protein PsYK624_062930 [Phanerochaete sordida]|uniref:Uncharacterized protein n=1 Tax=Phanerochaete sordida TaxID=48140 RepID=A0A9P3G8T2_9APHY|nr:hypothetical protein PsYK624_062930 [Phanerochaete sordida]
MEGKEGRKSGGDRDAEAQRQYQARGDINKRGDCYDKTLDRLPSLHSWISSASHEHPAVEGLLPRASAVDTSYAHSAKAG